MKKESDLFQSPQSFGFSLSQMHNEKPLQFEEQQQMRYIQTPLILKTSKISPFAQLYAESRLISPEKQRQKVEEHYIQPMKQLFSEEEEEVMQKLEEQVETPEKQQRNKEEEDIHSTGHKSISLKINQVKKSRPKDKGLRSLSSRAFKVVIDLKEATYKDVAERLLKQLAGQQELDTDNEETNVKRRVYDALNVLIAVGILEKQGRKIVVKNKKTKLTINQYDSQLKRSIQQIMNKEQIITQKRFKLEQLKRKKNKMKEVIQRNLKNNQKYNTTGEFIKFPYICMSSNNQKFKKVVHSQKQLHAFFGEMILPVGDFDSMLFLH